MCGPGLCGTECNLSDPCHTPETVCQNGGVCFENCGLTEALYICNCTEGFTGTNCTEEVNYLSYSLGYIYWVITYPFASLKAYL